VSFRGAKAITTLLMSFAPVVIFVVVVTWPRPGESLSPILGGLIGGVVGLAIAVAVTALVRRRKGHASTGDDIDATL
jgi:ABC-type Co2+ transport system permease subunit